MRKSLFRGKTKNGRWVYGDLWHRPYGKNTICIVSFTEDTGTTGGLEVIPETVGQDTGLKDKNGKKIFEGDVVGFVDMSSTEAGYYEQSCIGEVIWDKETISFQVTNRLSAESYEVVDDCTVIGNIHDNPELVEN